MALLPTLLQNGWLAGDERMPNVSAKTGAALITGAAGAKIRVTAASATTLTMDLDADGNGSYETSVNKLWSEML